MRRRKRRNRFREFLCRRHNTEAAFAAIPPSLRKPAHRDGRDVALLSPVEQGGQMNSLKGRWILQGSTIVIELPGKGSEAHSSFELESNQPTLQRGSSGSVVKT